MAIRKMRTISVPPDLAAQLKKHPKENWSAVAQNAWRKRLDQLEHRKVELIGIIPMKW